MHTNDKDRGSVDDDNAAPEMIPAPLWFDVVPGARVPADWDDLVMREVCTDRLRTVAQSAGEASSELFLRFTWRTWPGARRSDRGRLRHDLRGRDSRAPPPVGRLREQRAGQRWETVAPGHHCQKS
jgi:hypothetical protein